MDNHGMAVVGGLPEGCLRSNGCFHGVMHFHYPALCRCLSDSRRHEALRSRRSERNCPSHSDSSMGRAMINHGLVWELAMAGCRSRSWECMAGIAMAECGLQPVMADSMISHGFGRNETWLGAMINAM